MFLVYSLRKGMVYIPTAGMVPGGPYRMIEPVAVVTVTDGDALRQALRETIRRGNPKVPNLLRKNLPPPLLPQYAGVKTQTAFDRGAVYWWFREDDGLYKITGLKDGPIRGQVPAPNQTETFPPGTSVETVIDRMIAILQSAEAR